MKKDDYKIIDSEEQESEEQESEEYRKFVDKFKPKKTTDDCYTPPEVYEVVADWVAEEYKLDKKNFVRPFYPNGDYQNEEYKENDIVVDNPPFSILSEILKFYKENKIKFFLFAPSLTIMNYVGQDVTPIVAHARVVYENKAIVNTSFLTNLDNCMVRTAPKLYSQIELTIKKIKEETTKSVPKYIYPDEVLTAAMLGQYAHYDIDFRIEQGEAVRVRVLDCQKKKNKGIYGSGIFIAERKLAERKLAERKLAERKLAERKETYKWELSEREKEIIKQLG